MLGGTQSSQVRSGAATSAQATRVALRALVSMVCIAMKDADTQHPSNPSTEETAGRALNLLQDLVYPADNQSVQANRVASSEAKRRYPHAGYICVYRFGQTNFCRMSSWPLHGKPMVAASSTQHQLCCNICVSHQHSVGKLAHPKMVMLIQEMPHQIGLKLARQCYLSSGTRLGGWQQQRSCSIGCQSSLLRCKVILRPTCEKPLLKVRSVQPYPQGIFMSMAMLCTCFARHAMVLNVDLVHHGLKYSVCLYIHLTLVPSQVQYLFSQIIFGTIATLLRGCNVADILGRTPSDLSFQTLPRSLLGG